MVDNHVVCIILVWSISLQNSHICPHAVRMGKDGVLVVVDYRMESWWLISGYRSLGGYRVKES